MSRRCQDNTREKLHDSVDDSLPPLLLYVLWRLVVQECFRISPLQRKDKDIGHPTVTLDQEQKEELLYEVFEEYGDEPLPKS